ncbi:tyrosine-type recombinase/integrase [Hydrogenophaga sp. NFH-34]|uniref:tyrosine-type recombinase/integrase n=1 Tax=Hydrogenophaga sp. NFH-34 TaxID=2744446 RepID=UPI001F3C62CA|nr:integrase arm-type DNA-binding domain-containing protein [Hydrogenophaga sp. NFH-34]
MEFDARQAKILAQGSNLTFDSHPGLRLTARQRKKTWSYRYRSPVDDALRQIKIGEWPSMSYHAAVAKWEKLRQDREDGLDPALEKKKRSKSKTSTQASGTEKTVRQVCDIYLAGHVKNRAKKGRDEVARTFDTMLGDIADMRAIDVTRKIAFAHIKQYDHIPVQASNLRRELGAAWDYCLDSGDLPDNTPNWWRQILRGKLKSKGPKKLGVHKGTGKRVLSPDEVGELVRWLPNFSRAVNDFLTIYLWTAVRGAEIEKIEGREISEEKTGVWWTIPKIKTKNKNRDDADDQRVPLIGRAREIVLRRKEAYGDGYLFPSSGELGYFTQKSAGVAVYHHMPYSRTTPNRERVRLTVENWAPHDLRRTARTFLASLGCPRDIGEVILGHILEGVEGTYNRYTFDKERRHWLTKLDSYLESLVSR